MKPPLAPRETGSGGFTFRGGEVKRKLKMPPFGPSDLSLATPRITYAEGDPQSLP